MRRSHTPNADQCSAPCQTRLKGTIIRGVSEAISRNCHVQGLLDAQAGVTDGGRRIHRPISADQRRRTNARLFPHCSKPLLPVSRSCRHTLHEPAAFLDSFACGQLSVLQASPLRPPGPCRRISVVAGPTLRAALRAKRARGCETNTHYVALQRLRESRGRRRALSFLYAPFALLPTCTDVYPRPNGSGLRRNRTPRRSPHECAHSLAQRIKCPQMP